MLSYAGSNPASCASSRGRTQLASLPYPNQLVPTSRTGTCTSALLSTRPTARFPEVSSLTGPFRRPLTVSVPLALAVAQWPPRQFSAPHTTDGLHGRRTESAAPLGRPLIAFSPCLPCPLTLPPHAHCWTRSSFQLGPARALGRSPSPVTHVRIPPHPTGLWQAGPCTQPHLPGTTVIITPLPLPEHLLHVKSQELGTGCSL